MSEVAQASGIIAFFTSIIIPAILYGRRDGKLDAMGEKIGVLEEKEEARTRNDLEIARNMATRPDLQRVESKIDMLLTELTRR